MTACAQAVLSLDHFVHVHDDVLACLAGSCFTTQEDGQPPRTEADLICPRVLGEFTRLGLNVPDSFGASGDDDVSDAARGASETRDANSRVSTLEAESTLGLSAKEIHAALLTTYYLLLTHY